MLPPMTDPLSRYWRQPPREEIALDDTHALMSAEAFERLAEYSTTIPTGVYPGKAWRAEIDGVWFLRWFGEHPTDASLCTRNERELLVA